MGIAGLWSKWTSPQGKTIYSYTMLTINAEHHPLLRLMHKPADEKRMVVILAEDDYSRWLDADASVSGRYMRPYPADLLVVSAPRVEKGLF